MLSHRTSRGRGVISAFSIRTQGRGRGRNNPRLATTSGVRYNGYLTRGNRNRLLITIIDSPLHDGEYLVGAAKNNFLSTTGAGLRRYVRFFSNTHTHSHTLDVAGDARHARSDRVLGCLRPGRDDLRGVEWTAHDVYRAHGAYSGLHDFLVQVQNLVSHVYT